MQSITLDYLRILQDIATQEIASTNQKPKDEWQRYAPPLIFWFLCPKQNLH